MRCESWMDKTPIPRKTPRELARHDFSHWSDRCRKLEAELDEARRQVDAAIERIDRLDSQR
jgi:hypothetical protein